MPEYKVFTCKSPISSGDLRRMNVAPQPVAAAALGKVLKEAKTAPGGIVPQFVPTTGIEFSLADAITAAEAELAAGVPSVLVLKHQNGKRPRAVFFSCCPLGIEVRAE